MDKYKEMREKFVLSAIILAKKFEGVVGWAGGADLNQLLVNGRNRKSTI